MQELRKNLIIVALEWQRRYRVAPAITSDLSEYDVAKMVGVSDNEEYAEYMSDKTAVCKGHDFVHKGIRYQIKVIDQAESLEAS